MEYDATEWRHDVAAFFSHKWKCTDIPAQLDLRRRLEVPDDINWDTTEEDYESARRRLRRRFHIDFTGTCIAAWLTLPPQVPTMLTCRWCAGPEGGDNKHNVHTVHTASGRENYAKQDATTRVRGLTTQTK